MENSPVYTHTLNKEIDIELSEVLRYMGDATSRDVRVIQLAESAIQTVRGLMRCKCVYMLVDFPNVMNNTVDLNVCKVQSVSLSRYMQSCESVCVFAATIGIEFDRAQARANLLAPSKALALQAAGAAAIEAYCDHLCNEVFLVHAQKNGLSLKNRFSAGYGDLPLEVQKQIMTALDCQRKIGLTLTDGYMMVPTKSVTAFVGMSKEKSCAKNKCMSCENLNCNYRKGDY